LPGTAVAGRLADEWAITCSEDDEDETEHKLVGECLRFAARQSDERIRGATPDAVPLADALTKALPHLNADRLPRLIAEVIKAGDRLAGFGPTNESFPAVAKGLTKEALKEALARRVALQTAALNKGAGPPEAPLAPGKPAARHSVDFRSVHWFGTDYSFSEPQAAVVAVLWKEWEKGTPEVGHRILLSEAGLNTTRLPDVFKISKGHCHPAWDAMIRSNVGSKGSARLCQPNE
jgi:hypothetical protein